MNRKNVFLWTLYDFANSITTVVFFLYFSQWLVVDKGVPDFWYNMIFTIGSVLLLATAPILGSIADKNGKQQTYLNSVTIFTFLFLLGASLVTLFLSNNLLLAILFFGLGNYFYQFSFVFYNALLYYIAPKNKLGKISGIGQAGNWLGMITGLLITLPLASGAVYLFGEAGRAQTLLPAVILFILLALPMLLFFKLPKRQESSSSINLREEYKNFWGKFKELIKSPSMGIFLLSYFFFNDAIITVQNNFPLYLENVFAVSDKTKSFLLVGVLATSALGAFFSGWLTDKIGIKKSLMAVLGSYLFVFPLMGLIHNFTVFVTLAILMGFFFGATWTVSRTAMTALCPKDKLNFGFSFYTLFERFSTLLGPIAWGLIVTSLASLGPSRYRVAVISITIFVIIGMFLLKKVKIEENPI